MTVTATDKDGLTGAPASQIVTITSVALLPDCCDPGATALMIGGTSGNDHIQVVPVGNTGAVRVSLNSVQLGEFTPTAGGSSSTAWPVTTTSRWPAPYSTPRGWTGARQRPVVGRTRRRHPPRRRGGRPARRRLGPRPSGRRSRIDRLVGNADDDIVIAGAVDFRVIGMSDDEALCQIMDEWTSNRTPAQRVANLKARLLVTDGANRTVIDDADEDILTGSDGVDWFLYNFDGAGCGTESPTCTLASSGTTSISSMAFDAARRRQRRVVDLLVRPALTSPFGGAGATLSSER